MSKKRFLRFSKYTIKEKTSRRAIKRVFTPTRSLIIFLVFIKISNVISKGEVFHIKLIKKMVSTSPNSSCYIQQQVFFLLHSRISTTKSCRDQDENFHIVTKKKLCYVNSTPLASILHSFFLMFSTSRSLVDR